jgi:TPR repeat protein
VPPSCAACARADATSICGSCRFVAYCDATCQRAAWAAHKPICKAIAANMARDAAWVAVECDGCSEKFAPDARRGHRCSRCYSTEYCGTACQTSHWKREHKDVCKAVGEAAFAAKMSKVEGDPDCMYNVALAYEHGTGVAADARAAFEWYRKSAELGNLPAIKNLADFFSEGTGVAKDARAAFEWYRRGAEAGESHSQFSLAGCYAEGDGVAPDLVAAFKWFHRAAEAGYAPAQVKCGYCLSTGLGVPVDPRAGFEWFSRAAAQGDENGLLNVGVCFESGEGVARDFLEAHRWFVRADSLARGGDPVFQTALKNVALAFCT